ncbi:MAG: zinc-binding dehydrogenase [Anaerolineaceae bacterium]|nr:MAG: zinc-binding dehydrogenase [Anaerolineaceae bacterium]
MRAAVTVGKYKLEVRDIGIPELGPEEALIKVKYTGICGTDAHIYGGTFPLLNYPIVPGHEFVGTLVDINTRSTQLKDFKPGDWVVAQPFFSCYVCDTCAEGGDNYCNDINVLGVHVNGSMAEYVKVPAKKLVKVDEGADIQLVALTEPLGVGVHCLTKSGFKVGNSAFIIGGGVIGVMIAIAARVAGASKIILCDINEYRLDFVRSLGFEAMDTREPDFFNRLMAHTDGKGFDSVFEATGSAFGIKTMTAAAKRGGIIIQAGISAESHPLHVRSFSDKEIQIRGVRIHAFSDFKTALNILQSGKETAALSRVITNVYPLERAADAMSFQVKDANHFKVIVENESF